MPAWRLSTDAKLEAIPLDPPAGIDRDLAAAYRAVVGGIRECLRLQDSLGHLWTRPADYVELAGRVRRAEEAASAALLGVEARLARAGGVGAMLAAVNFIRSTAADAPFDPPPDEGRLNGIIVRLMTAGAERHARAGGSDLIQRIRHQLATCPPVGKTRHSAAKGSTRPLRAIKPPTIPTEYKAAMKLWPTYRKEMAAAGKRAIVKEFIDWLKRQPQPVAVNASFPQWRANYERLRRRYERGD